MCVWQYKADPGEREQIESFPSFQSLRGDGSLCKPGRHRTSLSQAPRWNTDTANKARRVTGDHGQISWLQCSREERGGQEGTQMYGDIAR